MLRIANWGEPLICELAQHRSGVYATLPPTNYFGDLLLDYWKTVAQKSLSREGRVEALGSSICIDTNVREPIESRDFFI